MDQILITLSYILGATGLIMFIIAAILFVKIIKLYGVGANKRNAIAFPIALAAFSALNLSLCIVLLIENVALALLIVYFISQLKIAKEVAAKTAQKKEAPKAEPKPEAAPQKALKTGDVVAHKATEEEKQEILERKVSTISVEEARNAVSDTVAAHFVDKKKSDVTRYQKKSIINIDTLSENFESGDSVNLEALLAKRLVPAGTDYVKILARGHLDKKLFVEANDYSADAIKMIILTDGTVTEII